MRTLQSICHPSDLTPVQLQLRHPERKTLLQQTGPKNLQANALHLDYRVPAQGCNKLGDLLTFAAGRLRLK